MRYQIGPAFRVTLFMTILTGLIYPGIVTGLCQMLFPHRANGSMVEVNGEVGGLRFDRPELQPSRSTSIPGPRRLETMDTTPALPMPPTTGRRIRN